MNIDRSILDKYIECNQRLCKEMKREQPQNEYVFFESNTESWPSLMISKFTTALALQRKYNLKVKAIKHSYDEDTEAIYKSLGFESHFFSYKQYPLYFVKAALKTISFCLFHNSPKALMGIHYKGVHIGDLIYDRMIRGGRYSIDKVKTKADLKVLMHGYIIADICEQLYKECPPAYFVAYDYICLNGICVRFARKHGAKIIAVGEGIASRLVPDQVSQGDYLPNYHAILGHEVNERLREGLPQDWEAVINDYLSNLFKGVGDWNTFNAFGNKKVSDRASFMKELGMNPEYKNVVIVSHCFTDSPHCGGDFIFNDYYDWLAKTLALVQNIKGVNWILKAHPSRAQYGEQGVVEALYEKYKSENLYWLPDHYSAEMLSKMADVLITVNGTAAIEFACFGIPSIVVGKAFYTKQGFTNDISTSEQYLNVLMHIDDIQRLNQEQINMAKKVLYINMQRRARVKDELVELAFSWYVKCFKDRENELTYNNGFVSEYVEKFDSKDKIKNSYYYLFGMDV